VVILLSLGFAVLMLSLPRDSGGANARGQCQNNLMAIAFALKGYHAQHGSFPPAYIADKNGKPLHSWRVLLLPYLERADVLRQYRFDEPWDGPNNRYLAVNRPRVYACPADPQQRQRSAATSYLAVVGPGVAWTGKKPVKLSDIRDNPHSTILVVEVINSEIHWMEPRDLDVEMMAKQVNFKTLRSISSGHGNGAFVAMADGSVRFLDNETTCAVLDALLTRAGGESLEDDASIP
jgi:hypothetical protein